MIVLRIVAFAVYLGAAPLRQRVFLLLVNQNRTLRGEQPDGLEGVMHRDAAQSAVHSKFHHRNSLSAVRRRHLILDLSRRGPTALNETREISPRLATAYANKTWRTIQRDFQILVGLGLLVIEGGKYRAKREEILMRRAFRHQPV
jgi:hypothetical protein